MSDYEALSLLLTAVISLTLLTLLYRDNVFFKIAENLIVGLGMGSAVVVAIERVYSLAVKKVLMGNIVLIAPLMLGFMSYLIYSRRYTWIGRIPMALMAALGLVFSATGLLRVNFIGQIMATMVPLTDWYNVLVIIGVSSSLLYFFYSVEHRGPVGGVVKLGRLVLMLTFGCFLSQGFFGFNTTMIGVWQNISQAPAFYVIPVACAIVAIDVVASRMGLLWHRVKTVSAEAKP